MPVSVAGCRRWQLDRSGSAPEKSRGVTAEMITMQRWAHTAIFTRGSAYSVAPGDGTSSQESIWENGADVGGPAISVAKDMALVLLGLAEEAKVWTQRLTRRRGGRFRPGLSHDELRMVSEPTNLLESNPRERTPADLNSVSRREVGAAVCLGSANLVTSR